jgi:amidophosphoribosyltransferase
VTTDSDLITGLLTAYPDLSVEAAAVTVLPTLRGAFSLVFMDEHTLYAARDGYGVRPLVLGRLDRGWVVAERDGRLDIVGASFVREVEPGELISIDDDGLRSERFVQPTPRAACSSTPTWPGRTPRSPAGTCRRPGSRSAAGWPASTRPRPTW